MIKWIIFDVDGTLIETAESNLKGLTVTMKDLYNKDFSDGELRGLMGTPGDSALRNLGIKEDEILSAWSYWGDKVKEYAHLDYVFDGVEEMLSSLSKSYNLALVTSKTHKQLEDDFIKRGLIKYFKLWVCKEDTNLHKPNPDPLLKALERAGVSPCEAIYLGDAMVDFMAASSINMKFGHCRFMEKYDKIDCDIVFNEPKDILYYFKCTDECGEFVG